MIWTLWAFSKLYIKAQCTRRKVHMLSVYRPMNLLHYSCVATTRSRNRLFSTQKHCLDLASSSYPYSIEG